MTIARYSLTALDCPDAAALAGFYAQITGGEVHGDDDGSWVELVTPSGAVLAFQQVDDYHAPDWPGQGNPQQLHLDFDVEDLDVAEPAILAIGARKHDVQPGTSFRVYLDPVGHPFCLVKG
jgi:hypothetical protein